MTPNDAFLIQLQEGQGMLDMGMSEAQLLAAVVAHTTSHAGEIALLKGIQGGEGLPY